MENPWQINGGAGGLVSRRCGIGLDNEGEVVEGHPGAQL